MQPQWLAGHVHVVDVRSSLRAMFDRMPQLAEGLPSRAALNELPSAIRNAPLRSRPASPIGSGLSRGGSAPVALARGRSRPGRCAGRPR